MNFRFGDIYQIVLIGLGVLASLLLGIFFYREVFPEYKIYQDDYIALEKFRSSYSGEAPPQFKVGVKQIVIEREDKGPPLIDRCTSCHVALQIPDFSPTIIARDINGQIQYDEKGFPVQVPNPQFIWDKLDQKIADLKDTDPDQAQEYADLKVAHVGDKVYDVTKVLRMHPLMGRETRPFEYHPVEEYGCTNCHNGNGRGLTTEKAHGPVFDGEYQTEFMGPHPEFLEKDPKNDPTFARVFNGKPGHELLFQTTPIYVGGLIEAKCMQCHQTSFNALQGLSTNANLVLGQREKELESAEKGYELEKNSTLALLELRDSLSKEGKEATIKKWDELSKTYTLPYAEQEAVASQLNFLNKTKDPLAKVNELLLEQLGSEKLVEALAASKQTTDLIGEFIDKNKNNPEAKGALFAKAASIELGKQILQHVKDVEESLSGTVENQQNISELITDVDRLTPHFRRGEQLYISQACYACHRISGFSRGGVGPELTRSGLSYPWYIKESIVWPQADLKTSTMPNAKLDHDELEDLVTFLLAQKGPSKAVSETTYRSAIQAWEAGKLQPWEKPVTPAQIQDLRFGMTIFATQGCASCHRLEGFESDVGFSIEKNKPTFDQLYEERQWFSKLFPEELQRSQIVSVIDTNKEQIDTKIQDGIRKGSILEEIEEKYPELIESFYTPFKFAFRAKNSDLKGKELEEWKERVHRVLMIYIQEYGLGRIIGPRPNWSGVMRTDEWLMEHFRNPAAHVPRSIMPVMPFDDTKFYALTYMLDILGQKNRNNLRAIWDQKGFNPAQAVKLLCAQCHGDYLQGNGPVSEWIYPIPKNLRRAEFLRNLTKERAIQSIMHGVKGTPMPPWGEVGSDKPMADKIPVLKEEEIKQLVNWIFSTLPGGTIIQQDQDVPKWQYSPQDVIEDLKKEGVEIPSSTSYNEIKDLFSLKEDFLVALDPMPLPLKKEATPKDEVNEIFDVIPNPVPGAEPYAYYIKKKYYTPQNLAKGQAFFLENCSVCHGREADGTGARAEAMAEAKPRMLTNLDWLNTRDDLRLLRSIKYGVSGTAMTPWGDFTSALQRMQLVMFIRSLSEDHSRRERLLNSIYKAFDTADLSIQQARSVEYQNLENLQNEYLNYKQHYESLLDQAKDSDEVLKYYKAATVAQTKLQAYEKVDQTLEQVRTIEKKEKDQFLNVGLTLLTSSVSAELFPYFLPLVELEFQRFALKDGHLEVVDGAEKEAQRNELEDKLIAKLTEIIDGKKNQLKVLKAKIASPDIQGQISQSEADIHNLEKLQRLIITNLEEADRLRIQQKELLNNFKNTLEQFNKKT